MKKVILALLLFLFAQNITLAEPTNISFIYINGSNNNDEKMKNWYEEGVKKLHPTLKERFEKNRDTKQWFNEETGIYHINEEPVIFFWGDKSKKDLTFVKEQLDIAKALSSSMSYIVKNMLTAYLHDAIWVQKPHNMKPILDELNEVVKSEYAKGNEVVLFGYSAGTFVTYQYMVNRLPYLDLVDLFNVVKISDENKKFIQDNPIKNTCIAALEKGKIGVVSSDGHLIMDPHHDTFKENYKNLDKVTDSVCAPQDTLKGVVNFASPLVLFYSDLADPDYELTYYNRLLLRYIMDDGLFWLTVNFREDPLGFPSSRNLTPKEIESRAGINLNNPSGLVYDNSGVWSKRSFLFAHTSYWTARRPFANAIVKSLVKGMKFNYDEDYQMQVLEKDERY